MYAYTRIHVYAYLGGLPYNYACTIIHICPSIRPRMPSVTSGIRPHAPRQCKIHFGTKAQSSSKLGHQQKQSKNRIVAYLGKRNVAAARAARATARARPPARARLPAADAAGTTVSRARRPR